MDLISLEGVRTVRMYPYSVLILYGVINLYILYIIIGGGTLKPA